MVGEKDSNELYEKILSDLRDPISLEIMDDPVILVESGQVYNRDSIQEALKNKLQCPVTGKVITDTQLVPCVMTRKMISALDLPLKNFKKQEDTLNKNLPKEINFEKLEALMKSLKFSWKKFSGEATLKTRTYTDLHEFKRKKTSLKDSTIISAIYRIFQERGKLGDFERILTNDKSMTNNQTTSVYSSPQNFPVYTGQSNFLQTTTTHNPVSLNEHTESSQEISPFMTNTLQDRYSFNLEKMIDSPDDIFDSEPGNDLQNTYEYNSSSIQPIELNQQNNPILNRNNSADEHSSISRSERTYVFGELNQKINKASEGQNNLFTPSLNKNNSADEHSSISRSERTHVFGELNQKINKASEGQNNSFIFFQNEEDSHFSLNDNNEVNTLLTSSIESGSEELGEKEQKKRRIEIKDEYNPQCD